MSKAPGTTIAGYRVVELLGSGGMGDVYIVENEQLQRREAMKVISVGGAPNQDFQQRFNNEARTMAALDHPSIITIHNYGIADDQPWFSMSYIDGPNLATARLSPPEVLEAIAQVADALDYAHSRSVVHRDIKPANIVITKNADGTLRRAVLLDFGIAKLADSPQLTAVNSIIGTVTYTAPEVISGATAGPASDQYSLACTVYELLAGHPPFKADTSTALMMAHIQQPPPPLGAVRPDLDALSPVLTRAMSKDPAARYPDARSFAGALTSALRNNGAGQHFSGAPAPMAGPHQTSGPQQVSGPQQTSGPQHTPIYTSGPQQAPMHPSGPQQAPFSQGMPIYGAGPSTTPQYGATVAATNQQFQNQYGVGQQFPNQPQPGQQFQSGPHQGPPSFPGKPYGFAGGPPPGPKKSKTPWIIAAVVAVIVIAIAGTSPLWWPSSSDSQTAEMFATPQIAGAAGSECMIENAELYCWGDNTDGQLGNGSTSAQTTPTKVVGLTNVTSVAMGSYDYTSSADTSVTTCAVSNSELYCWGNNLFNQAGDASTSSDKTSPYKVPGLGKVTTVGTSHSQTCAVSDGDVYCWGFYAGELLGQSDGSNSEKSPMKVGGISNVTALSVRAGTVCAISAEKLYCWGDNTNGQVGVGSASTTNTPAMVSSLSKVTSVAVGGGTSSDMRFWNTCAVADGAVYCWGSNVLNQLNSSSETTQPTPVKVEGLATGATQVTADIGTFCAIADGNASCWGNNRFGQIGNGGTVQQSAPVKVDAISNVRQVVTAYSTTCAMTTSGRYCWGLNKSGQAGDPSVSSDEVTTPQEIKLAA